MGDRDVQIIDVGVGVKSRLDQYLSGFHGALNVIASRIGPASKDKSIYTALQEINTSITEGFAAVAAEIAKLQTPEPPPAPIPLEVKFVFKVKNDHQDESFSIAIGGVTDAEGEPLPDASGLAVAVESSDPEVVAVNFDPASNSGSVHFGRSGVASLTASVTNAAGEILGSGAADFTVTTGDPAAVSDVKIAFSGLTEEPAPEE